MQNLRIRFNSDGYILSVLPWFSPDSEAIESYYGEPQEHVTQCLHCSKSECTNCQDPSAMNARLEAFEDMVRNKKSQKEICATLNISRATYFNYKNQIAAYA